MAADERDVKVCAHCGYATRWWESFMVIDELTGTSSFELCGKCADEFRDVIKHCRSTVLHG